MNRIMLLSACLLFVAIQQASSQTTKPLSEFCPDRTSRGTGENVKCAASYTYKGVTYNNVCTNVEFGTRYWCATVTGNYQGKWGVCEPKTCTPFCKRKTVTGTGRGAKCVFPFTYGGTTYNSCTNRDNRGRNWCSTTSAYTGLWGNCAYEAGCAPPFCQDRTFLGTADGAPCATPFMYGGQMYEECTNRDHFRPWCSTTPVYSGTWGNCLPKDCKQLCTDRTVKGTARGRPCVFPFTYKGKTYSQCTTKDNRDILWCSITSAFNGGWGNCVYEC